MSSRWLTVFAAAILISAGFTATSSACEKEKARSADASTASAKASCAKSATAAKAACSAKTSAARVASASTCSVGGAATAVFASNGSACPVSEACPHPCMESSAAAAHGCPAAKSAATADAAHGCSAAKAAMASAHESCSAHGAMNAVAQAGERVDAVVAGSSCQSSVKSTKHAHGGCEACADWAVCEGELANIQSQTQVVPLKNGVMYVFTASNPKEVRIVQAVLNGRSERIKALMEAGDKANLCPQCKAFRGAIASGNLSREIVNVEGGSLMIMTSPDNQMVDELHRLAGLEPTAHVKG